MNGRRLLDIIAYTVLAVAIVGFVLAHLKPEWWWARESVVVVERTAPSATAPPHTEKDFRAAARAGMAAVVAVLPSERTGAPTPSLPPDHPQIPLPQPLPSEIGSGVVISADGLIVTNAHVVEQAERVRVRVRFADGTAASAQVIGKDAETDLAVLRLTAPSALSLRPLPFAPDDSYAVGDIVLAIGHPFGVGQSVTMGIISALERTELGISTFEHFIQTDAAINPGNSGGALVDTAGRLVGINTAIFSQSGGNIGIGFAIPGRVVRPVVAALVREGRVRRGWLGVQLEPVVDAGNAAEERGESGGVLITAVLPDSPAQRAGIAKGDILRAVGNRPVHAIAEALDAVAALPPGEKVALTLERNGKPLTVTVTIAERPPLESP
ncbi:S1C family serine protease [Hydrogenophilus thiooxidans]|uniref:S1C family serine protease n=1 Tax=Hydrogenophilus thiooxidans TaxID=2820326 RepID=UPI001C21415A|nr:trypsin-like peptidase domain-containing protein [Hydrogenophilus thiooxidans]